MDRNLLAGTVLLGGLLFSTSALPAQSLGDVVRTSKPSQKASRVFTNDNLPEARGPANGAASMPASENASKQPMPAEAGTDQSPQKQASQATPDAKQAEREKELREEIRTVSAKIEEYSTRKEAESNEATRVALQTMIDGYESLRHKSQQELDQLLAAKNKKKATKETAK